MKKKLTPRQSKSRVRKAIKELVSILNRGSDVQYEDQIHLWYILTALRGPDSSYDTVKNLTTARIRGAIGLQSGNPGGATVCTKCPLFTVEFNRDEKALLSREQSSHFLTHYDMAVKALRYFDFIEREAPNGK